MATPHYQDEEKRASLEAIRRIRRRLAMEANNSPVHADAASDESHVEDKEPGHPEHMGSEHDIRAVHDHQHGENEEGTEGGMQTTDSHGDGKDWEESENEKDQPVGDKEDDRDERWLGEGDPRGRRNISESESDADSHEDVPAGASSGAGVSILRGSSRRRKVFHGRG